MLSACTKKFFSHHPDEVKEPCLIDHLLKIAKTSEDLFSQTSFPNRCIAFYSGLLHDIGKLNPFYQEIFNAKKSQLHLARKKALEKYVRRHSVFSAWAAYLLLEESGLADDIIDKIIVLIYGHHYKLRRNLGEITLDGEKFNRSKNGISSSSQTFSSLSEFHSQISNIDYFSKLNWNSCMKEFQYKIEFDINLNSQKLSDNTLNSPDDFLEVSYAFSCLLQADRGSFKERIVSNFDLQLNTESQSRKCELEDTRMAFQKHVMENFDDSEPISIINAPTGIGKTKVFLDIINERFKNNVQRIFYFSPLLALTEDFEAKIADMISKKDEDEDVLVYNHMYSGSLKEKKSLSVDKQNTADNNQHSNALEEKEDLDDDETQNYSSWEFENESFNKKFVITTTQRLLMTIYSNKSQDKMKMASFRNSVLIIDEIQTIPKPILSNLKEIFKKMNQYMGTKFILVSATIPNEISDIKRIELPKDDLDKYLLRTKKQIFFQSPLDVTTIPTDKTLVMANTRRKAVNLYSKISQRFTDKKIIYISAGIRKKDRIEIIKNLSAKSSENLSEKPNYILVATQVVEAGVDIDFSHVFREEAPLDNIIQVMGRLNREGSDTNAKLVIYSTDCKSVPYSPLEFKVTQEKLQKITNSVQIYEILDEYYEEISARNESNKNNTKELEDLIAMMDFDRVWKFVRDMALKEDSRDTVFIPDSGDWDDVKDELLHDMSRNSSKKFVGLTATLPVSSYNVGREMFDDELMEKNILLPKKKYLEDIYDKKMGLDKWAKNKTPCYVK